MWGRTGVNYSAKNLCRSWCRIAMCVVKKKKKTENTATAPGLFETSGLVFKEGVRSNKKDCEKVTGVGVVPS